MNRINLVRAELSRLSFKDRDTKKSGPVLSYVSMKRFIALIYYIKLLLYFNKKYTQD